MRFLTLVALIAGLAWASMVALVTFVKPYPREMSQIMPAARLNK